MNLLSIAITEKRKLVTYDAISDSRSSIVRFAGTRDLAFSSAAPNVEVCACRPAGPGVTGVVGTELVAERIGGCTFSLSHVGYAAANPGAGIGKAII